MPQRAEAIEENTRMRGAKFAQSVSGLVGLTCREPPKARSLDTTHEGLVQARPVQVAEQTSKHGCAAQAQQPEGGGIGLRTKGCDWVGCLRGAVQRQVHARRPGQHCPG